MDAATVLNRFGIPWPDADIDKANQAAAAWTAIANAANDALGKSNTMVSELTTGNSGPAMTAFTDYWSTVGGAPAECSSANAKAMLPVLIQTADALASACKDFIKAVQDAQHKLEEVAAEIVAALVAGGVATLFTAGISDAVGGLVSAGLIEAGLDEISVLGVSLQAILKAAATSAIAGGVDAILDAGMTNSVKVAFHDTPAGADDMYGNLLKGVVLGVTAGAAGKTVEGAAQTAADATLTHLPDSVAALIPDLPTVVAAMPEATGTPAGQALTKLTTEYAAKSAANAPEGKDTDPPTMQEILGEVLDAKIESAAEPEGG